MNQLTYQRLSNHRRQVNVLLGRQQRASEAVVDETKGLKTCKEQLTAVVGAQSIVQSIAQSLQQRAHDQIARVVSRCLAAVFEDPYEFQIRFDCKRGRTEARLLFVRDGLVLDDPLNEIGGGVVDVAALALRLTCILLSRPRLRRCVVLDEPFKCIRGVENRARTRQMLTQLSEELGFQVILSTDIKEFQLGTVVDFS